MWLNNRKESGWLETKIQAEARKYSLLRRWKLALKIAWATENGMPDYFFMRKTKRCEHCGRMGEILFIEFKKKDEVPSTQQLERHDEIRECGFNVVWVDNLEDAKRHLK